MTSFRYRTYRSLKSGLGEADSTVESIEVAVRKLEREAIESGDANSYLRDASKQSGVRVDQFDAGSLRLRAAHLYILSVYQHAEQFLESFWREVPGSETWPQRNKKVDLGTWIFDNVLAGINSGDRDQGSLFKDLFDYYRLVRNRFMHSRFDAEELEEKYQETKERWTESGKWSALDAPNRYEQMKFDDFILFSRVTKEFALWLNIAARPSDPDIAAMVLRDYLADAGEQGLKRMSRLRNNHSKLSEAVYKMVNRNYSLSLEEAKPVVEIILQGLLA